MAYNESPDNEFDQEMERILHEHFEAEDSNLRAPDDPWLWLESRLEEPAAPSFFSRLLGMMNPIREGRLSPGFAVAGVAVVAVAIAAIVWATSGDSVPEGLAIVQETEVPADASPSTVGLATTTMPNSVEVTRIVGRESNVGKQASAATTAPAAATALPVPTFAPADTEAPAAMMEEESASHPMPVATAAPAATTTPMPVATAAPAATTTPTSMPAAHPTPAAQGAMAAASGPQEPAGPEGAAGPQSRVASDGSSTPPDNTFRDYQRQPFVAASEDNVSTFSLDTDRTSYQLALNWARHGYEVEPPSVRAEEWINAFDYGYGQPEDGGSFFITTDVFHHPLDNRKHMARIGFQAPELLDATPLNVTLVMDASGSMREGNRVEVAYAAAESIRSSLNPRDRIAVVHFTTDVKHNLTVDHRQPDDDDVIWSIDRLQPGGSTNVQAGLNEGVRLADRARRERPDAYNYVIVFSDGVANVDATNPFAILESSPDYDSKNPLRIITVGVGIQNYNDVLLEQLAQYGNGWYRYLDNPEQAEAMFSRENWLALSAPFADQTRAQVTWDPNLVRAWRIVGYENRVTSDESFTEERKEFAEVYSGASTTVFYELELWSEAQRARDIELGSVELRWTDPVTGRPWRQRAAVSGHPATDFDYVGDTLLKFGAIVGLSSDRYSSLLDLYDEELGYLFDDLAALLDELDRLNRDLGRMQAYNDFAFLLDHITRDVWEMISENHSGSSSGYSR